MTLQRSFKNRKEQRKDARKQKSQRKADNYGKRKRVDVNEEKQKTWTQNYPKATPSSTPKVVKPTVMVPLKKKPRRKVWSGEKTAILEDPLLAFAEKAIDAGILGSDGEFDEDALNNVFAGGSFEMSDSADDGMSVDSDAMEYFSSKASTKNTDIEIRDQDDDDDEDDEDDDDDDDEEEDDEEDDDNDEEDDEEDECKDGKDNEEDDDKDNDKNDDNDDYDEDREKKRSLHLNRDTRPSTGTEKIKKEKNQASSKVVVSSNKVFRNAGTIGGDLDEIADTKADIELRRIMQGQVNRLTMCNFSGIANTIFGKLESTSRRTFNRIFIDIIVDFLTKQSNALESYIMNYSALVAALCSLIGIELLGGILERILNIIDSNKAELAHSSINDREIKSKLILNCVTFISYLYDLQIVASVTVTSLIEESIEKLGSELEVEILLKVIKICGAQLRRDDPASLKQIFETFTKELEKVPENTQSSRFKFLTEMIQDLKYNKQKLITVQTGDLDAAKKSIRTLIISKGVTKFEPATVTINEIRLAENNGRWWQVGAAWKGDPLVTNTTTNNQQNGHKSSSLTKVEEKAKLQHMNTDIRRSIFSALMTSEDYQDAYQRLICLKLSSKQEREIVHVLIHCVTHEKSYNPFYALVASQFIQVRHNFVISFKYAFWDRLRQLEEQEEEEGVNVGTKRSFIHSAKFFAALAVKGHLSLIALKRLNFVKDISGSLVHFLKIFFISIFDMAQQDVEIAVIFTKVYDAKERKGKVPKSSNVFGSDDDLSDRDSGQMEDEADDSLLRKEEASALKYGLKFFFKRYFDAESISSLAPSNRLKDIIRRLGVALDNL